MAAAAAAAALRRGARASAVRPPYLSRRTLASAPSSALTNFDWTDPLSLESQLTEEERGVGKAAREFARDKLQPRVVQAYRTESFDPKIMREMGEAGLLGSTIPPELGGAGVGYVSYGLIAREVEAVDSGFRSAMSVQSSLVMGPIFEHGSDEQRKKYLPDLAAGKLIGCFGLTEPDAGSDPASMRTHAIDDGDAFVLSGTKTWITNAPLAHVMVVWAKNRAEPNHPVRGFIVERDAVTRGTVSTPKIEGKLSLRASITGQIILDNVRVPKSAMLPNVKGMRGPFSCLNRARYGISWGAMGAAETCLRVARQYGLDRKQFGKPLAATQLQQLKLADMVSEIALGLQTSLRVGRLLESEGGCPPEAISLAKRNNCVKALAIARLARDMLGGNGIQDEYHVMRIAANLETVNTYEGAADVHALILGKAITGISAF